MGKKGRSANSRNSDPSTSHIAARDVEAVGTATTQRDLCLDAVIAAPGSTAGEVAEATGLDRHTASKRLPELRERKLLHNGASRICQVHGTTMMTWWPYDSSAPNPVAATPPDQRRVGAVPLSELLGLGNGEDD